MGARTHLPPPRGAEGRGDGDWVEIAFGLSRLYSRRLLRALGDAAVAWRTQEVGGGTAVFVRRCDVEESLFVLATVSFKSSDAAAGAPWRGAGIRAAALAGALVAAAVLWISPWDAETDLRCPGGDGSYLRAIRGGCVRVDANSALP
jgi:hypothetical protein